MKNKDFLFFLFFSINFIFGQERNLIKGKLLYKNTNVIAANVINNTAQLTTITDSNGEFEIEVTQGDEVIFSSVQYRIRSIIITSEILKKNRLVVSVNENITELKEVVVTTEDIEKFLNLKEDEFKGVDYDQDKSTKIINRAADDRLFTNGVNFVNIAKLIAKSFLGKTKEEQMSMKPSQILPYVFEEDFFEKDLKLGKEEVVDFLKFLDSRMKSEALLKQSQQFLLIDYLINESKVFREIKAD